MPSHLTARWAEGQAIPARLNSSGQNFAVVAVKARFEDPLTVADAVDAIAADELLLPGIQRSFVWKPVQITTLFDSLMRGYPFGSVLVWRTRPMDHKQLRFRRLVTDHQGGASLPHVAKPKTTAWIHAVLDGQQRLTAFNIGLRGSYATGVHSEPRRLYLDLEAPAEDPGAEANQYRFEFRLNGDGDDGVWFPVADAVGLDTGVDSLDVALDAVGVAKTAQHRKTLKRLAEALNHDRVLRVEVERKADLDRVLNIFARTNIGGTKLTYVDLLVSTATARWRHLDAREALERLRAEMNAAGEGFRFAPDRLVKAGLVLLDAQEPKFHVDSFSKGNKAQKLEELWPEFAVAMTTAAMTLASFGLSSKTLAAENVAIPIAYYAKQRKLKTSYASAHVHEKDRRLVRAFVARTLLQRGYWTGAVDPVLVAARKAIKSHGSSSFPLAEIERALAHVKPISVTDGLIDELCELRYGDRRTLLLLRLLFPDVQPVEGFDKDHIFPISRFQISQLKRDGVPLGDLDRLGWMADRLPNLQLVDRIDNRGGGKSAKMPKDWLQSLTPTTRKRYTSQHVKHLPADLSGFEAFWDKRRELLRSQIIDLLCV
jgi:hypothetical protein